MKGTACQHVCGNPSFVAVVCQCHFADGCLSNLSASPNGSQAVDLGLPLSFMQHDRKMTWESVFDSAQHKTSTSHIYTHIHTPTNLHTHAHIHTHTHTQKNIHSLQVYTYAYSKPKRTMTDLTKTIVATGLSSGLVRHTQFAACPPCSPNH